MGNEDIKFNGENFLEYAFPEEWTDYPIEIKLLKQEIISKRRLINQLLKLLHAEIDIESIQGPQVFFLSGDAQKIAEKIIEINTGLEIVRSELIRLYFSGANSN